MPILGLTNQLRMPRAGKIHLGIKSETSSGQEYPTPTDYFVCPPEVIEALGDDKPRVLTIMFPTDNPEQFADAHLKFFSRTRGLVCKGDGETADRTVNMRKILGPSGEIPPGKPNTPEEWPIVDRDAKPEDIGRHKIQCKGEQCPDYGKRGCGRMMMLQFLLPDVPGLGIYQIDTGSRNSILNIYGGIELVRAIVGHVAMVPLKLRIGPIQTTSPETGRQQTNYVMNLDCELTMEQLGRHRELPPSVGITKALPDPDDEVPEYLMAAELPEEQPTTSSHTVPTDEADNPVPTRPVQEQQGQPPDHGYGQEVWSMKTSEMLNRMRQRRENYGITKADLKAKADAIGLDKPQNIKPDQFIALMDWMDEVRLSNERPSHLSRESQPKAKAPTKAPAEPVPASEDRYTPDETAGPGDPQLQPGQQPADTEAKAKFAELVLRNHISQDMLRSAMDSFEIAGLDNISYEDLFELTQWAKAFSDDEHTGEEPAHQPNSEEFENPPSIPDVVQTPVREAGQAPGMVQEPATPEEESSLESLLTTVDDDYTWDSTLQLASQLGIRTQSGFEEEVLRMTTAEWERLDGTPATAARRLLRSKIMERDQAALNLPL